MANRVQGRRLAGRRTEPSRPEGHLLSLEGLRAARARYRVLRDSFRAIFAPIMGTKPSLFYDLGERGEERNIAPWGYVMRPALTALDLCVKQGIVGCVRASREAFFGFLDQLKAEYDAHIPAPMLAEITREPVVPIHDAYHALCKEQGEALPACAAAMIAADPIAVERATKEVDDVIAAARTWRQTLSRTNRPQLVRQ